MSSKVVLISGPPCSGKTTLAKKVLADLNIPLFSKDGIKEILFDALGYSDKEWSRKLGATSMHLLYYTLKQHLQVGQPIAIDSNFKPEIDRSRLEQLKNVYKIEFLEFHCHADASALFERFKSRWESGERHRGHVDNTYYRESQTTFIHLKKSRSGHDVHLDINVLHAPLQLGTVIEVNTTDFDSIDYEILRTKLSNFLSI